MTAAARPRHSIRFHSRSFHAMALAPQPPLADWLAEFDAWVERSPGFFVGRPIVLDLSGLQLSKEEAFALVKTLFERNIQIMGIEHGDPSWREFGMPPPFVSGGRYVNETPRGNVEAIARIVDRPAVEEAKAPEPATPVRPNALLIEAPLRSGQYIEHLEGDVIVVGSVASGAEIVAGGSIHVYGALRGRAIAGAGHPNARIFCRKLEAELLAIDGLYLTADDTDAALRGKPVQVRLDGDALTITVQD
ncbi:septum site-determining protein MinC [Methylocella silvestris]|uniref:Probable septum site-determining protein MinC n=1 Tax=Methylocella silvestris TaxID=199596 RepID=A0A2J7TEI2_METSI|nr:septum site-determining protein MinC [Methylocella silvestris]PNG25161.1 septum formation inhibitor MinC [Methylocella silvestris]